MLLVSSLLQRYCAKEAEVMSIALYRAAPTTFMTRIGVARGRGKVVLVQAGNRLCRSLAARVFSVSVGKEPHRQTSADIALLAKLLSVTLKRENTRAVLRWLASHKAALRRPRAYMYNPL